MLTNRCLIGIMCFEVICCENTQKTCCSIHRKTCILFYEICLLFCDMFYILCLVLSFMGRQTFFLHTDTGTYERAIYTEENHAPHSRSMTVRMGDDIHVWTNDNDQIELTTHLGLSFMYAVHVVPLILAFWFLSRVFSNISKGEIFIEQNAAYLLYYGLLQLFVAILVPFLKLFICHCTNLISGSQISISTGQDMLNSIVPSIAFIVAAYIIHYGISLQDEVDHTL